LKGRLDISEPITDDVAKNITAQFSDLRNGTYCKNVYNLWLNSPGGSVQAGLAIIDTMQSLGKPVKTTCNGMAASMAAVLLACGTKGKRFIHKNSRVMIHQPRLQLSGSTLTYPELKIITDELEKTRDLLVEIIAETTAKPGVDMKNWKRTVRKIMEVDKYMNAQEAVDFGIADHIIHALPPQLSELEDTAS